MSKWTTQRLEEIIQVNPTVKLTKGKVYPFIDIDKVSPSLRSVTNEDVKTYDGQSCSKFCNGDTVFSRITPCLENRKIAKVSIDGQTAFGSTEFYIFRAKEGKSDEDFVYYLTSSDAVVLPAINSMTGASGRQRADRRFIERTKLNVPDLPTQKRIADILSAYDDLIENNNQRIALLEKAAQGLYKEWFVRFRFPGHEADHMVESCLGKTPSSFNFIKMNEAFNYYIGGGWGNDEFSADFTEEAYVIRGTDFPNVQKGNLSTCPLRYHKKSNYAARALKANDIIIEVSGGTAEQPVGRTLLVTQDIINRLGGKVICASFCKQIRLNTEVVTPYYFYYWMQFLYDTRIIDRFQLQSTGIINFKFEYFLRKGDIMLPPRELMDKFDKKVKTLYEEIAILARQNENLAKQRDLLLPRLMSGKLEV